MSKDVLTTRGVLAAFGERIVESLRRRPLTLEPSAHRARIAALIGKAGGSDHYEFLGLDPAATADGIAQAYEELAREVSPTHAERLGISEQCAMFELLFERATEAYLVLSDPDRRRAYDRLEGFDRPHAKSEAELVEERQDHAAALYARAQGCLRAADFHFAVELLKEAARLDPRADFYALLGEAYAKNPKWLHHAEEALAHAVSRDASQVAWVLRLAQVREELGRTAEAREGFLEVLTRQPSNPEAGAGLARLDGGQGRSENPGPGGPSLIDRLLALLGLRRSTS